MYAEALVVATAKADAAATALEADELGAEAAAETRALRLQAARVDEQVSDVCAQHACVGSHDLREEPKQLCWHILGQLHLHQTQAGFESYQCRSGLWAPGCRQY
jgi:hypothetical protein